MPRSHGSLIRAIKTCKKFEVWVGGRKLECRLDQCLLGNARSGGAARSVLLCPRSEARHNTAAAARFRGDLVVAIVVDSRSRFLLRPPPNFLYWDLVVSSPFPTENPNYYLRPQAYQRSASNNKLASRYRKLELLSSQFASSLLL